MATGAKPAVDVGSIQQQILVVRGQRVLLDARLAELYGVTTKALNQAVRRNLDRFPGDFLLRLSADWVEILRSQFVTSSWGGRRTQPLAFTEQAPTRLKVSRCFPVSCAVSERSS